MLYQKNIIGLNSSFLEFVLSESLTPYYYCLIFSVLLSLSSQYFSILIKMHILTYVFYSLLLYSYSVPLSSPPACIPPTTFLFLTVSWGAEANEGWLRLLWLLQGHWLYGWLQWRLWTAVSPAACAPWRWPKFQQRTHVLRVRIASSK